MASDVVSIEAAYDEAAVQRNTLGTLFISQILGAIAVAAGIAMGGLILEYTTGSESAAGFAQAASTLGGALVAVPAARLAIRYGRRVSLASTYIYAAGGGVLVIIGAGLGLAAIALIGMFVFGAGSAASLQARFAGTDLATANNRGRTMSMMLFAVTAGGIVGPNLAEPTSHLAVGLGLPPYAGPFLVSVPFFLLGALLVVVRLRPDPLHVVAARHRVATIADVARPASKSMGVIAALRVLWKSVDGRIGLLAVVGAHAAMVSVMVMTPVHIGHAGHGLAAVGFVISGHVFGMYAFSPVFGWLTDRIGARWIAMLGAVLLLAACACAGTAADSATAQLAVGLFLLGFGWSASMVSGSLLVSNSTSDTDRPSVQGASDLTMGLAAALAASASGVIVAQWGYGALSVVAAFFTVPLIVALVLGLRRDTPQAV
ncbi:putative MFS family arabinose efflux permease [Antricoccus suffuscus]|uniref:Putative MFS family arabinose efflux permease n=1 Tax=Antricoccus suffuscus TaxID=1629062 RepID=A0A2T1A4U3_9ACTN|nr:MFS transporter [Antricoccus suffuscus]PRZ43621.1 putative MFS family arabinose efflux permease [Antricoccus suffuscus]